MVPQRKSIWPPALEPVALEVLAILDAEAAAAFGRLGDLPSGWVDELAGNQQVSGKNLISLGSTIFLI